MNDQKLKERGVMIMPGPSGKRWVKCCVTGKLIDLRDAYLIGLSKGHWYWRHRNKSIVGIPREELVPAK